jgi:hypothetical protein
MVGWDTGMAVAALDGLVRAVLLVAGAVWGCERHAGYTNPTQTSARC